MRFIIISTLVFGSGHSFREPGQLSNSVDSTNAQSTNTNGQSGQNTNSFGNGMGVQQPYNPNGNVVNPLDNGQNNQFGNGNNVNPNNQGGFPNNNGNQEVFPNNNGNQGGFPNNNGNQGGFPNNNGNQGGFPNNNGNNNGNNGNQGVFPGNNGNNNGNQGGFPGNNGNNNGNGGFPGNNGNNNGNNNGGFPNNSGNNNGNGGFPGNNGNNNGNNNGGFPNNSGNNNGNGGFPGNNGNNNGNGGFQENNCPTTPRNPFEDNKNFEKNVFGNKFTTLPAFVINSTQTAKQDFFAIVSRTNVTMAQKDVQMEQWAKTNGLTIQYNQYVLDEKTKTASLRANITTALNDIQTALTKLFAVQDNKTLTTEEIVRTIESALTTMGSQKRTVLNILVDIGMGQDRISDTNIGAGVTPAFGTAAPSFPVNPNGGIVPPQPNGNANVSG